MLVWARFNTKVALWVDATLFLMSICRNATRQTIEPKNNPGEFKGVYVGCQIGPNMEHQGIFTLTIPIGLNSKKNGELLFWCIIYLNSYEYTTKSEGFQGALAASYPGITHNVLWFLLEVHFTRAGPQLHVTEFHGNGWYPHSKCIPLAHGVCMTRHVW